MNMQLWKIMAKHYMTEFLKSKGWPWGSPTDVRNDDIMRLLPEMFRHLDRCDVIPPGFTYQQFYKAAHDKYQAARRNL